MSRDEDMLRKHLRHHLEGLLDVAQVVVWNDPSGILGPLLREVLPQSVEMPAFEGNPLSLRARIDTEDPWLDRKWLLYVPRLPEGTQCAWLADYEQGFQLVPHGGLSWALDQFFKLSETSELRPLLASPIAAELALHFGKYFPQAPDRLAPEDLRTALLRAAIQAPHADEVELVLRYLTSDEDAARWRDLGLLPTLTEAIKTRLGLGRHLADGHAPNREALCRCMVASALVETEAADARALVNHLPKDNLRARWAKMLDDGLQSPSRRPALVEALRTAIQPPSSDLLENLRDPLRLALGPAVPILDHCITRLLLAAYPKDESQRPTWWQEVVAVADERRAKSLLDDGLRRRWSAFSAAGQLLDLATQRLDALATLPLDAFDQLAADYVRPTDGDWRLDALYRRIPQAGGETSAEWEDRLLTPARQKYHQWVLRQTERVTKAVEIRGSLTAAQFRRHTEFWDVLVGVGTGTAVLCVDALRADLANELAQRLQKRQRQVEPAYALGQLPARTEVGMAALLPRADTGFAVQVEEGKLISYIGTTRLPGVEERKKHYAQVLSAQGLTHRRAEVTDFLKNDGAMLQECAQASELPIGYTLDIDDGGEIAANVTWEVFEKSLDRCEAFVERAFAAGFDRVVVGGDHGFLVRDPDAAPAGIKGTGSSAGGQARGFRYAAGTGTFAPELLHLTAAMLHRDGADVYVPRTTACLAVQGGPGLFVHGGLSLQECALVFLQVTPGKLAATKMLVPVQLAVPEVVHTQIVSVTLTAPAVSYPLHYATRKVRLELRNGQGQLVASTTHDQAFQPALKAAQASVQLDSGRAGIFTVLLLEAATGAVLQSLPVKVDVLGGDFDF